MDKYQSFYRSSEWANMRNLVYCKKGVFCTECLKRNKRVVATIIHHIVEIRVDFDKRLDLDNLIPVCATCHNKIHSDLKNGKGNRKPKRSYTIKV